MQAMAPTRGSGLWTPPLDPLPPTLGARVCRWIEKFLVHAEGDYQGEPFRLEDWQRRLIYELYSYDPVTLRRIVRRLLLVMPKGCGKTELVAALCLAEFAGPTQPTPDGHGEMRRSPNIPISAASFEQADRLFGAAKAMVTAGPLKPLVEAFDTEMLLKKRPGRLYRVAAIAGTNDGTLPTCFGADEIHEWEGRKERVHLVIGNSLAKRAGGLELNLSTPDAADPDSLFGRLHAYAERVRSGEVRDPSFLGVWYTAGEHWNLEDPMQLRAAITEATPATWLDVERIAARYEVDRIPEHEFRRYHLGQLVRPAGQWLPAESWEELADPERGQPPEGAEVGLFFDGSYNRDSSALVGCTMEEEPYVFVVGAWERPEGPAGEGWLVPREEVSARVRWAMERWRVRRMGCDPFGWHQEVEGWSETYGDQVVLLWETNRRREISAACSRFYTLVVDAGLSHDGNPALARHLRNAVVKETPQGAYITKDGRASPRKIDLAVAAVCAVEMTATVDPAPFFAAAWR